MIQQAAQQRQPRLLHIQAAGQRLHNSSKFLCAPAKDSQCGFVALLGTFHRDPAQRGDSCLAPVLVVHIVQDIPGVLAANEMQHAVSQKRRVHPPIQCPHSGGQRVPAQRIAAALIVDQMAEATYPGRFARFVHPEADGARARDQDAAGAVHRAPQGDLGIAAQQQLPRKSGRFQFLPDDLFQFAAGNARTAHADGAAFLQTAPVGEHLPQQFPKGLLADGGNIERPVFTAFALPIPVNFHLGAGAAAVDPDKHPLFPTFVGGLLPLRSLTIPILRATLNAKLSFPKEDLPWNIRF